MKRNPKHDWDCASIIRRRRWRSNFKTIVPVELYRGIRDSQLVGLSGYSKEGLPVIAIGVGLSTYDKASVHYYVQSHIQMNEYQDRVLLPSATKKHGRPTAPV
ncbi:hypothetical protein Bca52824_035750 [Brassica carinata]|uniref:Uncharacterized protein n=1 Tax=Brassica carinata TaxID=52824 RepID=A0A8X7S3W2_BRACI|nr:hypothetical protein Bca52824_035750 [Brassica carinata]